LLPRAARLAGSHCARSFTCGLTLSLLQHKPDERRRQYAAPSSDGGTNTANKNNDARLKATALSAVVVTPTNNTEQHDVDPEARASSLAERGHGRRKRKRSAAAADKIDALFNDAIERKVGQSGPGTGSCACFCEVRDEEKHT
jgi:hypothetical protein